MKNPHFSFTSCNKARLISEIDSMLEELNSFLDSLTEAAEDDKGSLIVKRIKGKPSYYVWADGKLRYLSCRETDEISRYAQSRYRKDLITVAKREIDQLKRCSEILKSTNKGPSDVGTVFDLLPEALKPFVDRYPLSDAEYAKNWQNDEKLIKKRRQNKKDKFHIYETQKGEYVMSKSEALIANILKDRGVPYHYEIAITPEIQLDYDRPIYDVGFDGKLRLAGYEPMAGFSPFNADTLHPDFLVLNKRTRKEYLWEHLGRVDEEGYCRKNLNRLLRLLNAGYKIGEDVIVTSESRDNPLDTGLVNEMIDRYLT